MLTVIPNTITQMWEVLDGDRVVADFNHEDDAKLFAAARVLLRLLRTCPHEVQATPEAACVLFYLKDI